MLPAILEDTLVGILLTLRTLYTRGQRSIVDRSTEGVAEVGIEREALVHQVRGQRAIGPRRGVTEDTAVIRVVGEGIGAIALDIDLLTCRGDDLQSREGFALFIERKGRRTTVEGVDTEVLLVESLEGVTYLLDLITIVGVVQ